MISCHFSSEWSRSCSVVISDFSSSERSSSCSDAEEVNEEEEVVPKNISLVSLEPRLASAGFRLAGL